MADKFTIKFRDDDPYAKLIMADGYVLWALEAIEEVVGHEGMGIILRDAGMENMIDNYPPDNLEPPGSGLTMGHYARLNASLLNFYGRAGRGMVRRVGRITTQKAMDRQSGVFNLATVIAAKLLPSGTKIKMGLSAMIAGWRTINNNFDQEFKATIEDGDDHWRLIVETDFTTAGLVSDYPLGWLMEGIVEEAAQRAFGKFFDVTQLECRSMGAPASVWRVPKTPSD